MAKNFEIRNSTAEFLIFMAEGKEDGIQVLYKDETIWATQKAMATLFDVGVPAISKHLKNIFESGELQKEVVVSKMEIATKHGAMEGKVQTSQVEFYNLDAVISVGYRVNSVRATQFRQWCTYVLRQFAVRGYVIDDDDGGLGETYRQILGCDGQADSLRCRKGHGGIRQRICRNGV